ncbi:hypothetical protein V6N13_016423 [Hibiscus sabdariffa]
MTAEVDAVIRGRESKPPPKMVVNEWGWRGIHSGEHDTVALKIVLVYIPRDDSGVDDCKCFVNQPCFARLPLPFLVCSKTVTFIEPLQMSGVNFYGKYGQISRLCPLILVRDMAFFAAFILLSGLVVTSSGHLYSHSIRHTSTWLTTESMCRLIRYSLTLQYK